MESSGSGSISSALDVGTKIVSIGGPLAIVGAIVADFAYWQEIDPGIFSIMSLSDHVISALATLPIAVALLFFTYVSLSIFAIIFKVPPHLFVSDAKKLVSDDGITIRQLQATLDMSRSVHRILLLVCLVMIVLIGGATIMFGGGIVGWLFVAAFVEGAIGCGFGSRGHVRPTIAMIGHTFYFLIFAATLGALLGQTAIHHQKLAGSHSIELASTSSAVQGWQLRYLTQGLFFIDDSTGRGRIVPWSEIKSIQTTDPITRD